MSTFDGVIKEYPLISIDCFLKKNGNFKSTAYFLSHCHRDHMQGLSWDNFYYLLTTRGFSKIYLSDVSSHLLKNDYEYRHLSQYLEVLPLERPTLIPLYDQNGEIQSRVVVTLLTAGHCLGSVMIFIEGYNGNILYTGDFRLPVGSSARLTYLHENERLKPLKSLYIDTTFCNASCLYIPSREECLKAVLSIVEPWVSKGPNHIVCFLCPYDYAYEFIFVELFKKFGMKTHVKSGKKRKYSGIKQIEDAVTSIASEARFHACALYREDPFTEDTYLHETPCGFISPDGKPVEIKKILPSAMFFQTKYFTDIAFLDERINMERVCYSTHPSLTEIRDMVSYLKPDKVFPNVVVEQTVEQILDLIYFGQETEDDEMSPLGELNSPHGKDFSSFENDSLPFFDDCYEIPKAKKIVADNPKKILHAVSSNKILSSDTDFENIEEQETALKEKVFLKDMQAGNNFLSENSPLKWYNPIVSSDEEIFENSSPASSLKEENDSDMAGISQEDNIKSSQEKNKTEIVHTNPLLPASSPNQSVNSSPSQSLISDKIFQTLNNPYNSKNAIHTEAECSYSVKKCSEFKKKERAKKNIEIYMRSEERQNRTLCSGSMFSVKIDASHKSFENIDSKNLSPIPSTSFYQEVCNFSPKNQPIEHDTIVKHYKSDSPKMILNNTVLIKNPCSKKDKNINDLDLFQEEPLVDKIAKSKAPCLEKNKDHISRSFHFIEKIIGSSDSEDEYSFKYVIKLPSKDANICRTSDGSHVNIMKSDLNNAKNRLEINHCKSNLNNCTEKSASDEKSPLKIHQEKRLHIESSIKNSNETESSILSTKRATDSEVCSFPEVSNGFHFKTSVMNEKSIGWSLELQRLFDLDDIAYNCSSENLGTSKSLENSLVKPVNNSLSSVPPRIDSKGKVLKNSDKPSEDQSSISKNLSSNKKLNSTELIKNPNIKGTTSENDNYQSLVNSSSDRAAEKYLQKPFEDQIVFSDITHKGFNFSCSFPSNDESKVAILKQDSNMSCKNQSSTQNSLLNKADNLNVVSFASVSKQNFDQLRDQNFGLGDFCLNTSSQNFHHDLKNQYSSCNKDRHSNKVSACNNSEEKYTYVAEIKKPTVEVVDLLSDNSNDDIVIIGQTADEKSKSISNAQILKHYAQPSTSYPYPNNSIPSYPVYTNKFENVLSNSKTKPTMKKKGFLSSIDYSRRMSKSKSKSKSDSELKTEIDKGKSISSQSCKSNEGSIYNEESSERFLQEILLDHCSKNKINRKFNQQFQTDAEEKSVAQKITSLNQTFPSSGVEELDSSSDIDDSPSLISSVTAVDKISFDKSNFCGSNCCDSKKRKVDAAQVSRDHIRCGHCNKSNVNICDKYLIDSDSTPDDLLENCSLVSNQNIAFQRHSQEIIIDDV